VKKSILTLAVFALSSYTFAQTSAIAQREATANSTQKNKALAAAVSPLATSACAYNFTSGAGDTFVKYCVTVNGNITQLETPQGHEHIAVGAFGEGYNVCDESSHPSVGYFDYADFGDSGTWGAPTLVNQTATVVKITRISTDGIWTLTQTITDVASTGTVNIAMTLKNNSTIDRFASLIRYADVDADGTFLNSFDETPRTAFGWRPSAFGIDNGGLQIVNVGTTAFMHAAVSHPSPVGPTCTQPADVGTETQVDGSIVMIYFLGTIPHGKSVNVTTAYKGL
jgi:hypothetical protein